MMARRFGIILGVMTTFDSKLASRTAKTPFGYASLRPRRVPSLRPCGELSLRPRGIASLRPRRMSLLRPRGIASLRPRGEFSRRPRRESTVLSRRGMSPYQCEISGRNAIVRGLMEAREDERGNRDGSTRSGKESR